MYIILSWKCFIIARSFQQHHFIDKIKVEKSVKQKEGKEVNLVKESRDIFNNIFKHNK